MTTPDIVERLRANMHKYPGFQNLNTEAADEIERLRGEIVGWQSAVETVEQHRDEYRTECERLRNAAKEPEERIADLVAQVGELNLSYHQTRTRLAAAEKVVEAGESAVDYQRSLMFYENPCRPEDARDGITPKWFIDIRSALTAYAAAKGGGE